MDHQNLGESREDRDLGGPLSLWRLRAHHGDVWTWDVGVLGPQKTNEQHGAVEWHGTAEITPDGLLQGFTTAQGAASGLLFRGILTAATDELYHALQDALQTVRAAELPQGKGDGGTSTPPVWERFQIEPPGSFPGPETRDTEEPPAAPSRPKRIPQRLPLTGDDARSIEAQKDDPRKWCGKSDAPCHFIDSKLAGIPDAGPWPDHICPTTARRITSRWASGRHSSPLTTGRWADLWPLPIGRAALELEADRYGDEGLLLVHHVFDGYEEAILAVHLIIDGQSIDLFGLTRSPHQGEGGDRADWVAGEFVYVPHGAQSSQADAILRRAQGWWRKEIERKEASGRRRLEEDPNAGWRDLAEEAVRLEHEFPEWSQLRIAYHVGLVAAIEDEGKARDPEEAAVKRLQRYKKLLKESRE